jgi:amino acid transporter
MAALLLVTSVFAATLSFHNSVARYTFAMARDGVLPEFLARLRVKSAAPVAGSVAQSVLAAVVVFVFAVAGADPLTQLFTWLSYLAAVGLLLLLIGTCAAVVGFFLRNPQQAAVENRWRTAVAPVLALLLLAGVLVVALANGGAVLGGGPHSPVLFVLLAVICAAIVIGLVRALVLMLGRQPDRYWLIGSGGQNDFPVPASASPFGQAAKEWSGARL